MSSLERLPPDQRAVLALVLQRGRSYDDIADLLAIDRAAVRDRALAALDTLGPSETELPAAQRALITDYLLGQLPAQVRDDVRDRLAASPPDRAWARVLAGELSPLAAKPLPPIPNAQAARAQAPEPARTPEPEAAAPEAAPEPEAAAAAPAAAAPDHAEGAPVAPAESPRAARVPPPTAPGRPADRRSGTVLLLLAVVIAAVVVIIIVATSGSSSPKKKATTHPSTSTTPAGTTGTSTTAPSFHIIARIELHPAQGSSKAIGAAEVVTESGHPGVVVAAQHLAPNTRHNAYAVWLSTPGGSSRLLGYVSPPVGKSGILSTTGPFPSDASSYKELLVTLETTADTKSPGPTVLEGTLSLG